MRTEEQSELNPSTRNYVFLLLSPQSSPLIARAGIWALLISLKKMSFPRGYFYSTLFSKIKIALPLLNLYQTILRLVSPFTLGHVFQIFLNQC